MWTIFGKGAAHGGNVTAAPVTVIHAASGLEPLSTGEAFAEVSSEKSHRCTSPYPDKQRPSNLVKAIPNSFAVLASRSLSRHLRTCSGHSVESCSIGSYGAPFPGDSIALTSCSSAPSPDSMRSLKLIAGMPSVNGKENCAKLREKALHELAREDLDVENRPPSPRPLDEEEELLQHSKQMQIWEESIRLAHSMGQSCGVDLASITYRRTSWSSDGPSDLKKQHSVSDVDADMDD